MLYYHGTTAGELQVLQPRVSPFSHLKQACVYLTTIRSLATVYIWNRPYKWMTFEIGENNIPVYIESFPNSLKEFYDGVEGYICDYPFSDATGIRSAAISESPVPVSTCQIVENAYEQMLRNEGEGSIILCRYECLTDERRAANEQMVLGAIRRLHLLDGAHPLSGFVHEKFPDLWERSKTDQTSRL